MNPEFIPLCISGPPLCLFPNQSLEQVLAELLLERAQKNLIKYQVMAPGVRDQV